LKSWDVESCSARSGSLGAGLPWGRAPLDADFGVVTHFSRPGGWQGSLLSSTEFVPENQRGLSMPLMRPPSPNFPGFLQARSLAPSWVLRYILKVRLPAVMCSKLSCIYRKNGFWSLEENFVLFCFVFGLVWLSQCLIK
jgi:hypothetical protein